MIYNCRRCRLCVWGCIDKRENDTPYIVMGCSSGYDPLKAIYRGVMEAVAILYLAINGAVVMPKDYLEAYTNENILTWIVMLLIGLL